jgi:hypothetical protein
MAKRESIDSPENFWKICPSGAKNAVKVLVFSRRKILGILERFFVLGDFSGVGEHFLA